MDIYGILTYIWLISIIMVDVGKYYHSWISYGYESFLREGLLECQTYPQMAAAQAICFFFRDAGALKSSPAFNAAFETRDIGWPNARRFLNLHFWISRDFSGQWWFKTRDHKAKPVRFPLIKICKDVVCRIKAGYRLPTPIFLGRFIQILIGEMNSLQDTSWYKAHAASKEINGCTAQRLRTWT